jgi:multiple antibiotic resistance protein
LLDIMLDFLLTALTSILFVVDPPGALPTYLVMTANDDPARRRRTAWRAGIMATLTLLVFASVGHGVFRWLNLTMPAFQIAGGLILFLVAVDMIRARRYTQEEPGEVNEGVAKDDVAITPLAVPMLAGPAAMATVTVLISRAHNPAEVLIVYLAILVTGAVSYVTLRLAEPIHRVLGKTGIQVFGRVLGLILAGIAVQFILDGLAAAGYVRAR